MTYRAAYDYFISLINLPRREYVKDPKHCGVYLERMRALLKILGSPEKKIPHYIHITGTSGKGSVARLLASVLQAGGQRVGLLTSPHPSVMLERFEINGRLMPQKKFVELIERLKTALEKFLTVSECDIPSFTELTTILGLMFFAEQRAPWVVLEVGCGGRYDATNVIPRKDAAIITNVGLDHVDILGNTKTKIAFEKAGIIKPGSLVFTMDADAKVLKILERECKKTHTTLTRVKKNEGKIITSNLAGSAFRAGGAEYHLNALGTHQITNALLARRVALALGFSKRDIQRGLARVKFPVCLEIVSRRPLIILDGAHNPDKMKTTVEAVRKVQSPKPARPNSRSGRSKVHLVVGFAANKNIGAMARQLATLKPKTIACTRFTVNPFRKAADPRTIATAFRRYLPKTQLAMFLDPRAALAWSKREQKKIGGWLLATGSIFLSGELRAKLRPD